MAGYFIFSKDFNDESELNDTEVFGVGILFFTRCKDVNNLSPHMLLALKVFTTLHPFNSSKAVV